MADLKSIVNNFYNPNIRIKKFYTEQISQLDPTDSAYAQTIKEKFDLYLPLYLKNNADEEPPTEAELVLLQNCIAQAAIIVDPSSENFNEKEVFFAYITVQAYQCAIHEDHIVLTSPELRTLASDKVTVLLSRPYQSTNKETADEFWGTANKVSSWEKLRDLQLQKKDPEGCSRALIQQFNSDMNEFLADRESITATWSPAFTVIFLSLVWQALANSLLSVAFLKDPRSFDFKYLNMTQVTIYGAILKKINVNPEDLEDTSPSKILKACIVAMNKSLNRGVAQSQRYQQHDPLIKQEKTLPWYRLFTCCVKKPDKGLKEQLIKPAENSK